MMRCLVIFLLVCAATCLGLLEAEEKLPADEKLTRHNRDVKRTCKENAVAYLSFEKNQILNFYKQRTRMNNHNQTTANNLEKKGEFKDAAKSFLHSLGGDISNPRCGDAGTNSSTRSLKSSHNTYDTLQNCSNSIQEACTINKETPFNQTKIDNCAFTFDQMKAAGTDCRTNSDYRNNRTAACDCWEKAAAGIEYAKKKGCISLASNTAKKVKEAKNKCLTAFAICKKAEDSANSLIHSCNSM